MSDLNQLLNVPPPKQTTTLQRTTGDSSGPGNSCVEEAPFTGEQYARKNGSWQIVQQALMPNPVLVWVGPNPPPDSAEFPLIDGRGWFDTDNGKTYIFFDDGDTQQWVENAGFYYVDDPISVAAAKTAANAAASYATQAANSASLANTSKLGADAALASATTQANAAAASATAASNSAAQSGIYASDSSGFANQAKSYRDAGLAAANVYGSVGEGITAGVPYFDVPIDLGYNDFIRYKNSGGTAVEVYRYSVAPAMLNYWGISTEGEVQFRPDAINPNSAACALWKIAPQFMFVDRFGVTPVTALGDLVGLVVPTNAEHGPNIITDPGFDTGTGWTFNAGWARTGNQAVATATNSTLRWVTTLVAQRRYFLEFDVTVFTAGTLTLNVGSGTAIPITAVGHYRLFPQCGGAPTGGLTFTGTGFTGSVDNVQIREASPFILGAQSDAERGTYALHAFTGCPIVAMPAGKRMKTESRLTMGVPTYICLALARDVVTTFTMAAFGAGTGSITFVDNTSKTMSITTARSGVFASPNTRTGQFPVGVPKVVDCYLEAGFTSAYPDGGRRDVQGAVGLSSGAKRKLPNTFVPGDSYPNAYFGINYTTGAATTANSDFAGGFMLLGQLTEAQRMKVIEYFRAETRLSLLDQNEYDGFLQIGQSNELAAPGTENPLVPPFNTAAEYIDTGALKPLHDPAQHSVPANVSISGSAGPAFAIAYYNATGRKPLMVGSAYSGEGLVVGAIAGGTWLGPKLTPWAAFKFKNAMKDYKVIPRAAILSVGEQDVTHTHTQAEYEGYLIQLRDYLRKELGIPNFPILLKSLDDNATVPAAYATIRAAQENVCATQEGFYMAVPFQNYLASGHLVSGIHLDQFALDNSGTLLGNYAAAMFTQ